jgi:hypothetical protein
LACWASFAGSVRFAGATFQRLNGTAGIEARAIGRAELTREDCGYDPGVKLTRIIDGEFLSWVSRPKSRHLQDLLF